MTAADVIKTAQSVARTLPELNFKRGKSGGTMRQKQYANDIYREYASNRIARRSITIGFDAAKAEIVEILKAREAGAILDGLVTVSYEVKVTEAMIDAFMKKAEQHGRLAIALINNK